jgi:hypothetical protein
MGQESAAPYAQGEVSVGRVVWCSRPAKPDRVTWWMWDTPVLRVQSQARAAVGHPMSSSASQHNSTRARILYRSKIGSGSLPCKLSAADRLRRERRI